MKKKFRLIIYFIILFVMVFIGFLFYSKTKSPYMNEEEIKKVLTNTKLYTVVEYEGVEHIINIEMYEEDNQLYGDLYVPGNYKDKLCLFWDNDNNEEIIVKSFVSSYKNGQCPINDKTISLIINNKTVDLIILMVQTSNKVEPLFLEIDESLGSIDDMNNDWNHNTSCYGKATFKNESYYMSIKGRGNSTWHGTPKRPYNITFMDAEYLKKQSVSMIENISSKKWSLLANYNDLSLLRNKIGYDLANQLSVGLDSEYFDVWMNGDFLGNYLITPKSDYQATENGFILEIDNTIDEEDPQFNLKDNGKEVETLRFTVKNNDAELPVSDIQIYMQKVWDAIRDYDSDEYAKYLDIDSWAKVYLLNEFYKNYDVVWGSILMHKDNQTESDKLIAGPIWDLDHAIGQLTPYPELGLSDDILFSGGYWYISSLNLTDGKYSFFQELGKHKSFLEKVKEIYIDNYDLFNDIENQIDINADNALDSFLADFRKWGNEREYNHSYTSDNWNYGGDYPVNYQPTNVYNDYLENLKKYINVRVNFLNENINDIK